MDEESIASNVNKAGAATVVIMISLMILQYLLKKSIEKIKNLFLAIQIVQALTFIPIFFPVNVSLVLRHVRSFVKFELISPKVLLGYVVSQEKLDSIFGAALQKINQNLKDSGFTNSSIQSSDLSIYILAISVMLVFVVILLPILKKASKSKKFEEKCAELKKKFIWNGLIHMFTL